MSVPETSEIAAVVARVQNWPPMRIALARRILETLENAPAHEPARSGGDE